MQVYEEGTKTWKSIQEDICRTNGIPDLYPHQKHAVKWILEATGYLNRSGSTAEGLLVSLPTGGGKSLCFMAPAGLLPGISIILYPLNALLRDQQRRFADANISAEIFYGGMDAPAKAEAVMRLRNGRSRVLLTNLESCFSPDLLDALHDLPVSLLIVDEGHLILQWGLSFRPSLFRLFQLAEHLGRPVSAVFTATISRRDRNILGRLLWPSGRWKEIEQLSDRPNIHYRVIPCIDPEVALLLLLSNFSVSAQSFPERSIKDIGDMANESDIADLRLPILVFCRSRRRCETLAFRLRCWLDDSLAIGVRAYHAGMERRKRTMLESWFSREARSIMVATKAFGTGVDMPGIRTVIHIEEPESMEDFLQESGRAGRDGKSAVSILLRSNARLFGQGCRRSEALEAINQEAENCSGCDVCDGDVAEKPLEQSALERWRRQSDLQFRRKDEAAIFAPTALGRLQPEAFIRLQDMSDSFSWKKNGKQIL